MREFFRGWRRKAGCVTLVMACVVAGMWMRSQERFDLLTIPTGSSSREVARSYKGRLYWFSYFESDPDYFDGWRSGWQSEYESVEGGHFDDWVVSVTGVTWSGFWGFEFAHHEHERVNYKVSVRSVPYSYIVFPLTLLSAYLLLSKPCKQTGADHG